MPRFNVGWIYILVLVSLVTVYFMGGDSVSGSASRTTSYKQFKIYVEKGFASKIVVNKTESKVKMFVKPEHIRDVFGKGTEQTGPEPFVAVEIGSVDQVESFITEKQKEGKFSGDFAYDNKQSNDLWNILNLLFPISMIVLFLYFMFGRSGMGGGVGGGIFNVGKSKAKMYEKGGDLGITFKDVAGQAEAKTEVEEIVEFLKNPKKYTDLGGKIPKGALLVGPPGTGKTLLAKAVAGEADVPFFSLSGSDFVEMFVGVGASRVRDLFRQAKEKSPCIIFIDEIDAVGRARGKNPAMGGNDERENTLNQLLTEMDGFGTNSGVIILAATNRVDILDKALLRAGRFDRQIHLDLPDLNERKEVFGVHLRNIKLSPDVDVDLLARQTPGFSGADIANVCNEAALIAARRNKDSIEKQDFLDAIDRIVGGLEKKNSVITQSEKKVIAFHEAGHATTSWMLEHAHPLVKVTIVPRGKALGAAWYLPDERQITTKEQMYHEMIATLGGRAAEQIIFGQISTGALNDLEKVSKQAHAMVMYYGLDEAIGNVSYYDSTGQQDYAFTKPFSEKTAEKIDAEVSKIIESAYQEALRILNEHKDGLTQLAEKLIDQEVIFTDDLVSIFGERPWKREERAFSRRKEEQPEDNGQSFNPENTTIA